MTVCPCMPDITAVPRVTLWPRPFSSRPSGPRTCAWLFSLPMGKRVSMAFR